MTREAEITRETRETHVSLRLSRRGDAVEIRYSTGESAPDLAASAVSMTSLATEVGI